MKTNQDRSGQATIDDYKQRTALKESLDLDGIRGELNKMIDEAIQHRGTQ